MTTYEARFIIECLRAGIASSSVSELFSHGQTRVTNAFLEHLDRGAGGMAIEGGYGQGKTHLLKHLAQLARRRGYVVSLVTLSKETPFHHWWHLYGQAISTAERPDSQHERGLRGLLRRAGGGEETAQRLREFSEQLHPRLSVLLQAYGETRDSEIQHRLLGDLMGQALTNAALGKLFKEVTGKRAPSMPAARLAETGRDYFAFAAKLFQLSGYAGWVILFDEFELVCKLSTLQRAKAYANLETLRQTGAAPGFERITAVTAFIPAMVTDFLLGGPTDLTRLPAALRTRGQEAEAKAAESSIRWLIERKHPLALLGETETFEVLDRIAALHEQAYGWKRKAEWGRFYAPTLSAAERMRTKVRYCVEALDLAHRYGEPPRIRSQEVDLPKLREDERYYAGALDEVVVEDVDR
jgi:hypothetical protein